MCLHDFCIIGSNVWRAQYCPACSLCSWSVTHSAPQTLKHHSSTLAKLFSASLCRLRLNISLNVRTCFYNSSTDKGQYRCDCSFPCNGSSHCNHGKRRYFFTFRGAMLLVKDKCNNVVYTFVNSDMQWITHWRFRSNYAELSEREHFCPMTVFVFALSNWGMSSGPQDIRQ